MDLTFLSLFLQSKLVGPLMGALVGCSLSKDCDTWKKKVAFVFGGWAVSVYCALPVAHHFGVTDPDTLVGVGFGMAVVWQQVVSFAVAQMQKRFGIGGSDA